ncbi:MAG: 4-hydroxy-tetrahydrodipicolinate synthase, partial [Lancefieldella rimae]
MDMTHLTGAITALVTPFDEKGNVDFAALERFVDFQVDGGIDGLLVLGTTGESATMTDAEDVEVVRTVVERVAGRVPVIGGAGSNATAESMRKSKMLQEAGVDGLLLITPYYNKSNEEGIYRHFSYVLDRVDVPCLLYNVPSRTGCALSEANVARLSKHANAWGIKEASGDIGNVAKIMHMCDGNIDIYSGNDDQVVPLLSLGGIGVISVLSNV